MPSFASITVNDGQATPVPHVFSPQKIDANSVATFKERVGSNLVGQPTLSVQVKEPAKGTNGAFRVNIKLSLPKVVSVTDSNGNPVTKVAYTPMFDGSFVLPQDSVEAERVDLLALVANVLNNAAVKPVVTKVESFY